METKALIDSLSDKLEMDRQRVETLVASLVDIIGDECSNLDSIAVPGFGTFETRKRLERVTVHPSTGRRMLIPPKISLTFRPSALLKQKVK